MRRMLTPAQLARRKKREAWLEENRGVAMLTVLVGLILFVGIAGAIVAMTRYESDQIILRCQVISGYDVQRCGRTSLQQEAFDRDRREAADAARWDREARRILGQ